jgi:hypothetical protein
LKPKKQYRPQRIECELHEEQQGVSDFVLVVLHFIPDEPGGNTHEYIEHCPDGHEYP